MNEPQAHAQIAYEAWLRSKESPPIPPTPGQVAYAAYRQRFVVYQHHASGTVMPEPWEDLPLLVQMCWEVAADAVLDAAKDPGDAMAALRALADEARPFLTDAFGAVLRGIDVRGLDDVTGDAMLRVVARVDSSDVPYLDGLLRLFDEIWWLANCHRSDGRLVFDYETCEEDTAVSPEDYAATGGTICPSCAGTDMARGGCTPRGPQVVTRSLDCENCGATWTAVYTLSGYEGLEPAHKGEEH